MKQALLTTGLVVGLMVALSGSASAQYCGPAYGGGYYGGGYYSGPSISFGYQTYGGGFGGYYAPPARRFGGYYGGGGGYFAPRRSFRRAPRFGRRGGYCW